MVFLVKVLVVMDANSPEFIIRLVATLGQKSIVKKVSRKAILDVNVPKACESISTPDAPMALRLQSNLLYATAFESSVSVPNVPQIRNFTRLFPTMRLCSV